jgi:hypothetical protein
MSFHPYSTPYDGITRFSNQEGNHKVHSTEVTAFEVVYKDGTTETVADVSSHGADGGFLFFCGGPHGNLIKSLNLDVVKGYGPVPNPEAVVKPKYSYLVTLKDGTTKLVQADLFRVAVHGLEAQVQVYEFFTRVPDNGTREELTMPFDSVQMVERVEDLTTKNASSTTI